jgi:hypothetical protein
MYELGFYIPEDGILHRHRSEHLKSYATYNGVRRDSGLGRGRDGCEQMGHGATI